MAEFAIPDMQEVGYLGYKSKTDCLNSPYMALID